MWVTVLVNESEAQKMRESGPAGTTRSRVARPYHNLGLFYEPFLAGRDRGPVSRRRAIVGLSGLIRFRRIPLGISVENAVLEIVGLKPGSGLIMGDFLGEAADSHVIR